MPILESLVKSGTQPGVISSNLDEAFRKISEKYEQAPCTKIFIPGQAPIEVPIVNTTSDNVVFETSVLLDLNDETWEAL